MKIMKKRSLLLSIYTLLCAFTLIPVAVPTHAETTGSINCNFDELPDVTFHLYKVAVQDGNDGYETIGAFADMPEIDLTATTAAETLEQYIAANQVTEDAEVTTDENGYYEFTNLTLGAYLIVGDNFSRGGLRYEISPVLVSVPTKVKNKLTYDVNIDAKYDKQGVLNMTKDIEVQKVWSDNSDSAGKRPSSITVQLSNDDGVYEEMTLSKDNNWTYLWTNLDGNQNWYVTEKDKLSDYKVAIEQSVDSSNNNNVYVITNTYKPSTDSTTPTTPSTNSTTPTNTTNKIPQTGQLWWPVGILLCAGMVMILAGLKIHKN